MVASRSRSEARETAGHLVERCGQPAQLVPARHPQPVVEVPAGDPLGAGLQGPYAGEDPPAEQQGQRHRDRQGQQGRGDDQGDRVPPGGRQRPIAVQDQEEGLVHHLLARGHHPGGQPFGDLLEQDYLLSGSTIHPFHVRYDLGEQDSHLFGTVRDDLQLFASLSAFRPRFLDQLLQGRIFQLPLDPGSLLPIGEIGAGHREQLVDAPRDAVRQEVLLHGAVDPSAGVQEDPDHDDGQDDGKEDVGPQLRLDRHSGPSVYDVHRVGS